MTESFERTTPALRIEVLAPHDLPTEAATWSPEKVTMYWLSGQPQAWRARVHVAPSPADHSGTDEPTSGGHSHAPGQWVEIDEATAQRLDECPEEELAELVSGW